MPTSPEAASVVERLQARCYVADTLGEKGVAIRVSELRALLAELALAKQHLDVGCGYGPSPNFTASVDALYTPDSAEER